MTQRKTPDVICIGSVLWDVIGRTGHDMPLGSDKPGRILRTPGGVAMNIAMTLQNLGRAPAVLTVVGRDSQGESLMAAAEDLGIDTRFACRHAELPTDVYMAIESPAGLVAAIADAHSLEAAGDMILAPLRDGRLGDAASPWTGMVALDGNLTEELLAQLATAPDLARADLRVAPASPGKARRLLALRPHARATYYVNREEAGLLCDTEFDTARAGAEALVASGLSRVIVTDGGRETADATADRTLTAQPPAIEVRRITGAGDSFMAAHIAAEMAGAEREDALAQALLVAARFVSGEDA